MGSSMICPMSILKRECDNAWRTKDSSDSYTLLLKDNQVVSSAHFSLFQAVSASFNSYSLSGHGLKSNENAMNDSWKSLLLTR